MRGKQLEGSKESLFENFITKTCAQNYVAHTFKAVPHTSKYLRHSWEKQEGQGSQFQDLALEAFGAHMCLATMGNRELDLQ